MSLLGLLERVDKGHGLDGSHGPSEGLWIPAAAFTQIPASTVITQAEDATGVDCVVITASGAQSPILEAILPLSGRVTATTSGRGIQVADVTWYYAVLTASLTSLTITANKVGWAAANAVAAAPTVTAVTVTNLPAVLTLTASAANAFYTVTSSLALAAQSTADREALRFRIAPVMANTGVFKFAGAQIHFAEV